MTAPMDFLQQEEAKMTPSSTATTNIAPGGIVNANTPGSLNPALFQAACVCGGDIDFPHTDIHCPHVLALRRKKNRESMQRARLKQKLLLEKLRKEAAALEQQYERLLQAENQAKSQAPNSTAKDHLIALSTQLLEEKCRLRDELKAREAMEDKIMRLFEDMRQMSSPDVEMFLQDELNANSWLGTPPDSMTKDPFVSEKLCTQLILVSTKEALATQRLLHLLTHEMTFFGWTTRHHTNPKDGMCTIYFRKFFKNVPAFQVMQATWQSEKRMRTYREYAPGTNQQLSILQEVNEHAFVLKRVVNVTPAMSLSVYYLKFLLKEQNKYIIGTQTITEDDRIERCEEENSIKEEKEWHEPRIWAERGYFWIEVIPMHDTTTEEEHCEVVIHGKMAAGKKEQADRNALETILGLIKWESVNVAPVFVLPSSVLNQEIKVSQAPAPASASASVPVPGAP